MASSVDRPMAFIFVSANVREFAAFEATRSTLGEVVADFLVIVAGVGHFFAANDYVTV
jgi:hypothetical protein